ncbi:MAG: AEC family transporter, partial [Kiritimatiellae bacterium]|nr:AEC family transporter [Kiritimatiellia bacterium]
CMLFTDISAAYIEGGAAMRVAGAVMGASLAVLLLAAAGARLWRLPGPAARACIQGAFRGNLAYVGLPVVIYALSSHPDARATATLALAPTIPFFNVVSVLVLLKSGGDSPARRLVRSLVEIARNPLIIACLLGLVALRYGVQLPAPLQRTVEGVGRLGLPAALFSLGATLTWQRVRGHALLATGTGLFKVAVAPLAGVVAARLCGLRGELLTVCLLYMAAPTAVASYVMADQMGADREVAAAIIVVSTLLAFPALAVVMVMTG